MRRCSLFQCLTSSLDRPVSHRPDMIFAHSIVSAMFEYYHILLSGMCHSSAYVRLIECLLAFTPVLYEDPLDSLFIHTETSTWRIESSAHSHHLPPLCLCAFLYPFTSLYLHLSLSTSLSSLPSYLPSHPPSHPPSLSPSLFFSSSLLCPCHL